MFKKSSEQAGFTLIEVMIVVVILGILAGIVVPKLLDRPEEARRVKAITQINGLSEALELYKLDNGMFPTTQQGLTALVTKPEVGNSTALRNYRAGGYLERVPVDPWGYAFQYLSPGTNHPFEIVSYGADGQPGGEDAAKDIKSWEVLR